MLSDEMPFCCSLEHIFQRFSLALVLQLRIVKFIPKLHVFYITEKHVIYVINTKLHTCFDIARHIALIRYKEGFNLDLQSHCISFLIMNSCN